MSEPINPFGVFPSTAPRGADTPSPMPPLPADLDTASLTSASGSQLDFWIDSANKISTNAGGKKVLIKKGKVDERRQRLADYYGLDLSVIPVAPAIGPITRDKDINNRQWSYLRSLGTEWATRGENFRLIEESTSAPSATHSSLLPSIQSAITEALGGLADIASISSVTTANEGSNNPMDSETVQALIESAKEGDMTSIVDLFKLHASITHSTVSHPTIDHENTSESSSAPHAPPSSSTPTLTLTSTPIHQSNQPALDSIILASGGVSVQALEKADGLRDVIQQHESGEVAKIRALYGPQAGRDTDLMWGKIKVTITRRERLAAEFETQFNGDKEKFFSFFAKPDPPSKSKGKSGKQGKRLRPLRRVVEAIPHRERDLLTEQQREEYQKDGTFAEELWAQKWGGQNRWEIWRAIGKEKY
ncbi:hypothetical protein C8R43DRAFT_345514 [Mycena crocata]|nr:hypothetical protein C8R43DRAFT_345514 [Mycena crocata]